MSKTVWGISQGEYSDYGIVCVCPSKKEAEKLCEKLNGDPDRPTWDGYQVEEWTEADSSLEKVEILMCFASISLEGEELPVHSGGETIWTGWNWSGLEIYEWHIRPLSQS